jgi:hypothetical protein
MVRILFAALVAAFVFSGWMAPAVANPESYLTEEGIARMAAADGVKARWHTARNICIEEGFAPGTERYSVCFAQYRNHSLKALRGRARALTDAVARKHGLCIDRRLFEIARCNEI